MRWRGTLISLLCGMGMHSLAFGASLEQIRVWPAPDETRIVMDMDEKPVFKYFTLTKPYRLVVDLIQTDNRSSLPMKVENSRILAKVRHSTPPQQSTYRLVFELKNKSIPRIFRLKPIGEFGHRLVIDLPHNQNVILPKLTEAEKKQVKFNATKVSAAKKRVKEKPKGQVKNSKPTESDLLVAAPFGTEDIIIAIDPGHGGNDPGALGPGRGKKRNHEKNVTLPISRMVAEQLNATQGIKAILTRTGDYFVGLNQRSEIARKNRAHLLVSIHADGFHQPQPRGASVWVLSNGRARNEMGRWMEKHEEQSNLLGGGGILLENNNDKNLSRAVLDLLKRNSQKESYQVAKSVLRELKKVAYLHKDEPAYASLAVLKSPDIPSLLVEAGFMSNPKEEKLLQTRAHQRKIANAVYRGIMSYFKDSPPDGTLLSALRYGVKHTVKSGQSLSHIAGLYGVSESKIRTDNQLKTNKLNHGQVLMIHGMNAAHLLALSNKKSMNRPPSTISSMRIHTVHSGEYLSKIAQQYGVSVASIRENNRLRSDALKVGQKLRIIGGTLKNEQHKVKRGEYLEKIANQYGVSVERIRTVNRLPSDQLAIGQTLVIPGS